jgi:nucleoside 2-deoxyribosyltransferase
MKKPYVYLCSRIAEEARPLNDRVAASLRAAGFEVYVPHEQKPNNPTPEDKAAGRWDVATIFKLDYEAMERADICVVVGKTGRDCAWEKGWFYAKEIPIFFVPNGDESWKTCPMLIPGFTEFPHLHDPDTVGEAIRSLANNALQEAG